MRKIHISMCVYIYIDICANITHSLIVSDRARDKLKWIQIYSNLQFMSITHMYVCMYIYMYIYICIYICICTCMYIYTYIYILCMYIYI